MCRPAAVVSISATTSISRPLSILTFIVGAGEIPSNSHSSPHARPPCSKPIRFDLFRTHRRSTLSASHYFLIFPGLVCFYISHTPLHLLDIYILSMPSCATLLPSAVPELDLSLTMGFNSNCIFWQWVDYSFGHLLLATLVTCCQRPVYPTSLATIVFPTSLSRRFYLFPVCLLFSSLPAAVLAFLS